MRISDWSSDVCSSDLHREIADRSDIGPTRGELGQALESRVRVIDRAEVVEAVSRHRGQRCEIQVQVDEIGRASCRARVCPVRVDLGGSSCSNKKTVTPDSHSKEQETDMQNN